MAEWFAESRTFWNEFVFLFLLCGAGLALAQYDFLVRFTRTAARWRDRCGFVVLLYAVAAAELWLNASAGGRFALEWSGAFLFARAVLGCDGATAALAALLNGMTEVLIFGLLGVGQSLLFSWAYGGGAVGVAALFYLVPPLEIAVCYGCYRRLARYGRAAPVDLRCMLAVFAPSALVVLCVGVVFDLEYSAVEVAAGAAERTPRVFSDGAVLIFLLAALAGTAAALYAHRRLSGYVAAEQAFAERRRREEMARVYTEELKERYRATRAFRHDWRNHLLTLRGLLGRGESAAAAAYLQRLEDASDELFFEVATGSAALDALLSHKLGAARQLAAAVECAVGIPPEFAAAEYELCVIFANGLDNALKACAAVPPESRRIRLASRRQGAFLLLEIENSRAPDGAFRRGEGLGLGNIRAAAARYQGAVETEAAADRFALRVLLCIPLPRPDISSQVAGKRPAFDG